MYDVLLIINELFISDVTINRFFEICNKFYLIKKTIKPGGTQKINLLHKDGGRVVYFGYKHQRKFNEQLKILLWGGQF
jgi:hypothetical protein